MKLMLNGWEGWYAIKELFKPTVAGQASQQ